MFFFNKLNLDTAKVKFMNSTLRLLKIVFENKS